MPSFLLSAAVIATIGIVISVGVALYSSRLAIVEVHRRDLELVELIGRIRHFDETLTMSARLHAVTGDPGWRRKYEAVEPKLDQDIKRLIALSPAIYDTKGGVEVDDANQRLVEMERRSFDAAARGSKDEAMLLVCGGEYNAQKSRYHDANERVNAALLAKAADDRERLDRMILLGACGSGAALVIVVAAWLKVAQRLRAYVASSRAADAADAARIAAERANRLKSDFLAHMSHELRTPLNAIQGFSSVLCDARDSSDAQRSDWATLIHVNAGHMLTLVNDLLDLSKVESGQMTLERNRTDLTRVLANVMSVGRVQAAQKQLRLELIYENAVPREIQSDPTRLQQVLINLVANALKFTEAGGVTIGVSCSRDAGAGRVRFEVSDTGIGIPADRIHSIFDPYQQADPTITRRFGGTGLGVSISKRIVDALGGSLEVSSEPGVGSRFSFEIDAGSLDDTRFDEHPPEATTEPCAELGVADALRGIHVLVVDDYDTNRRLFDVVLRRAGAVVAQAEDGAQAVELAMSQPFDLILMDMQMPVLNGLEATRKLRAVGCRTPVVMLTAQAFDADRAACFEAGCDGHLAKPIQPGALIRAVATYLKRTPIDRSETAARWADAAAALSDDEKNDAVCEVHNGVDELVELAQHAAPDPARRA